MNDKERQDYYDRKIRRADETAALYFKFCVVLLLIAAAYWFFNTVI